MDDIISIPLVDNNGNIRYFTEPNKARRHIFWVRIIMVSSSKNRLRDLSVNIFVPPSDPHQKLVVSKVNIPAEITTDKHGNNIFSAEVDVVPPRKREEIILRGEVYLRPYCVVGDWGRTQSKSIEHATRGRLQDHTRTEILRLLDELGLDRTDDIREIAFRIVAYIRRRVKYFKSPYRLGAMFALKQSKGSCDEIADLTVALLRARGIEARSVIGYYLYEALHEWVEIKTQVGWVPIDPTAGLIGGLGSRWLKLFVEPKPSTKPIRISGTGQGKIAVEIGLDNKTFIRKTLITPPKKFERWKL